MLIFIIILILWYMVGIGTTLFCILIKDGDDVLVEDVPFILFISILGPLLIVFTLYFVYKETVLIKAKKE